MFKKVLFPTDFSEPAKTELNCISSVPGIREIILLHVIRQYAIPMGADMVETLETQAAEVYLQEAKDYLTTLNPDICVTLEEVLSPDITDAILETAESGNADLIVIHAYIKGIMTGLLRGCVPTKVLCRVSTTNILLMPNTLVQTLTGKTFEKFCPMLFSRILCPTNFSELSVKTTALAAGMKGVGEIIVLHVAGKGADRSEQEEEIVTARKQMNEICEQIAGRGIRARTIVVRGDPEQEILRVADNEDASCIWMRSAGKGCLHDLFFGSLVHEVVMHTTRPVIIIRSCR
jgi:nucleotide-binding universal stress UspA family protein